jgi:hypothetical protein
LLGKKCTPLARILSRESNTPLTDNGRIETRAAEGLWSAAGTDRDAWWHYACILRKNILPDERGCNRKRAAFPRLGTVSTLYACDGFGPMSDELPATVRAEGQGAFRRRR